MAGWELGNVTEETGVCVEVGPRRFPSNCSGEKSRGPVMRPADGRLV